MNGVHVVVVGFGSAVLLPYSDRETQSESIGGTVAGKAAYLATYSADYAVFQKFVNYFILTRRRVL